MNVGIVVKYSGGSGQQMQAEWLMATTSVKLLWCNVVKHFYKPTEFELVKCKLVSYSSCQWQDYGQLSSRFLLHMYFLNAVLV